jgi:hypothetical protein
MKTTCKVAAGLASLVLALISLWAVFNPTTAYAMDATVKCADGSTKSCSGVSCQGQDSTSGSTGYCACTKTDGSVEVKYCTDGFLQPRVPFPRPY